MLILGRFDSTGSAIIDIEVAGPSGSKKYSATIDTGFSGFIALPYLEIIDLGLSIHGAANVQLGDGSIITRNLSSGKVLLGDLETTGTIILDETSAEVLLGMDFLREFRLALILTNSAIVLYDEREGSDEIIRLMSAAPRGQPNTSPSSSDT
jgi:predicted aspartyl protease